MTLIVVVHVRFRMRELGNGHTVMFFAPLEVNEIIPTPTHKGDRNIRITIADVLEWAIHGTWTDVRQRALYWARQGMSHKKRYDAWNCFCNHEITREWLVDAWLQPEAKSLPELYAPRKTGFSASSRSTSSEPKRDINRRCDDLGVANHRSIVYTCNT